MPKRDEGLLVLWPHYFDARRSRGEGRRVAKAMAVDKPDAAWVEAAARKAGLKPQLQEDSKHPSLPHHKAGRVLVAKDGSKEAVLRKVAAAMQR